MSTLEEKKFLQLIKFSFDLSLKVTRTFTKTNVLNTYNNSFVDFLNAKKHEIYHLWNNNTRCCVCTSNALLKHNRDLNKDQFTKLFNINGNATPGHFKKGQGKYIVQYCFCGISCITSCSLDDLDVILIHTLLRKFVKLNPDDEMWLDTIRQIRNNLAHAVSTTCFDQGRLDKWWFKLEKSVLGLAGKIPPNNYADIMEDHIKLLGKFDFNIKDEEIRNLIETENKKLYDKIVNEHDSKCQQIMDKQDMYAKDNIVKSETIKEEIIKHLKQTKDDLLIEIKRLTFPVKLHGMETEVKSGTTGTTVNQRKAELTDIKCKQEPSQSPSTACQNEQYSERCQVEWRLKTPDTWRVEQIKQTLDNVSGMLRQWFHIEFIYVGSLILHTSVPRHILRDRQCLESAIQSFLEKIVEVCEINTDVPETVIVDFRVLELTSHIDKVFFTSIISDSITFTMKFKGIPTHPEEARLLDVNRKFYAQWIWTCPDSWDVQSLVENIEKKTSHLQDWFIVDLVHVDHSGKLVIHTTTEQQVFNTAESLTTAATTFLHKIIDICNLQTDRPEEVEIEVAVLSDIDNVTETVKSDVTRLTKFPMHSETESTTDEDNVSCKHCHKQFPCDQCSVRRTICKQIGFLVEDNRRKTQIITDMGMELELGDSNDHGFSQITKTTEPLDLGEPPYKMPRLSGHGVDAETTSTQPEAEYINWLKKNIEIYKGRVESMKQSLLICRRSKARINAKHRQLKQSSKELTMNDRSELVRAQQIFKRKKSDFDTMTKQLQCYQTALQSQGQSTEIGERFEKGPDTADTESSDDIMCQLCVSDPRPAVYWCTECVQAMCRECTTVHRTQPTSSTHTTVLLTHDYNFQIKGIGIRDIASLCEGVLIISDDRGNQLITCDIRGQNKQFIPLPHLPHILSVIDQNTVAVTTYAKKVLIVDVRQKNITKAIDIKKVCWGIMYRDNHLYASCDKSLVKVDMSGEIIRTVPLSYTPWRICSGTEGRIYCTDYINTVYCIDTEGNTVFTVNNPDMSNPWGITTDNEGHVLVVCRVSKNVHRISPDGKQCNVIIKHIPLRIRRYPLICYDSISKSIVIGIKDTFYVYKI